MSDDPPFQPPESSGWQPPGGQAPGSSSGQPAGVPPAPGKQRRFALGGGYSLLGLGFGLLLGLGLPPFIFGLLASILGSLEAPGWLTLLVPLIAAIGITVAAFVLLAKQLDKGDSSQSSVRTALLVAGYTSIGLWVLGSIIFGVCIALLASAY